jgi:hypothetical protein
VSSRDQQSALKGARDAESREDTAPASGQALQDQIEEALQPAMAELRERLTTSVRRELEGKLHDGGRPSHSPTERSSEGPSEGRQSALRQGTARTEDDEAEQGRPDGTHREPTRRESSDLDLSDEVAGSLSTASPALGRALQEQISQALQPAMAEFREQMAASVRREFDETLDADRRRAPIHAGRPNDPGQTEAEAPSDEDADRSTDAARSPGARPSGERGGQAMRSLLGKPLLEALPAVLEQQGEQWLRSRLDMGVDFLFSVWVRAAIQQEVERTLQGATRVATNFISDRATREDLRAQVERTVESVVGTALDRLFADDVRDDLKERGRRAIEALFEPDLKSVLHQVQDLLLALVEGLLAVLRECWEQILRLLGKVVMALLQPRLTAMLKDAFQSLATTPGRGGEKAERDSSTAAEDEDEEPRQARSGPPDDASPDDPDELDEPQRRGREGAAIADSRDERAEQRPGRAPSGRPPAGRPPASRQTSGRSFSDRAASGRPSRTASR